MTGTELYTLAADIAAELSKLRKPETWSVMDFTPSDFIKHVADAKEAKICLNGDTSQHIYLNSDRSEGKVFVGGKFPNYKGNTFPDRRPANILFSPTRSAATIAKDINRRYVQEYVEAYANGIAETTKWEQADNDRQRLAEDLAAAYGGRVEKDHPNEVRFNLTKNYPHVEVNSGTSVNFKIDSVSPDVARVLIAALVSVLPPKRCKACGTILGYRDYCMNPECNYSFTFQDAELETVKASKLQSGDNVYLKDRWGIATKIVNSGGNATFDFMAYVQGLRGETKISLPLNTKVLRRT